MLSLNWKNAIVVFFWRDGAIVAATTARTPDEADRLMLLFEVSERQR